MGPSESAEFLVLFAPVTSHITCNKLQGGHSPVMIKFPDFSLTFPDISRQNLWSTDPRNSSDTKRNACHFSLQYSYILSTVTTSLYLVKNSFLAHFVSRTICAVSGHMQEHIFPDFSFFPWPFLKSLTIPGFPGVWPPWNYHTCDNEPSSHSPVADLYTTCFLLLLTFLTLSLDLLPLLFIWVNVLEPTQFHVFLECAQRL